MTAELLPFLVTTVVATLCGIVLMVAVKQPALLPGTVHPFAPSANPADDTLTDEAALVSTVLTDTADWKLVTLSRLCDVEALLDDLEAHAVAERQVHTFGNNTFAVRWR